MIKIDTEKKHLTVSYNNEIILQHDPTNPVFYLGSGIATIDNYRGNYDILDTVSNRIALEDFEVEDNSILFFNRTHRLQVSFEEIDNRLHILLNYQGNMNRFWIRIYATDSEKVYGCGAQASFFNLRGKNVPLWTSESGVGRDDSSITKHYADLYDKAGGNNFTTYYPEPTFVSTRKYWLHFNTYAYAKFNFESLTFHELYSWEVPDEIILSFQANLLEVITDITDYIGKPPKLPEFLLDGMILGVQGGIKQVKEYLKLAKNHDVLVNGLWCQDWAGHKTTSFGKRLFWNWTLNETLYPKLKEEITAFKKQNVHFMTYICPFLLENESLFNEAKVDNYLVFDQEGDIYKVDFGEFDCGIVDLTNPDAFNWYKGVIKRNIIDLGIEGWMADFGEYLPVDCVLYNGKIATKMHNEWPVLWARCNYEAVQESNKQSEVFYFMRSGNYQTQKYAASLWAGDQSANWEQHDGIASVIPISLSTGIIGNPYIHSDIGGYTSLYGNIRTKELFERWLEMNVFSAYMRTHEGNRPAENFQFYESEETLDLMSRMTHIRHDLIPYIKHIMDEANELGYPLQRALFLHYEYDLKLYDMQYQYLFGQDILVNPVIEPNTKQMKIYLPDDEWVHLWTGKHYSGLKEVEVDCPIGYPPVFYREKSKFKQLFEQITTQYK